MDWLNVLVFLHFLLHACCVTLPAGNVVAPEARILSDANIDDFPYQAALLFENKYHICSGTIVSERHIVTNSECVSIIVALSDSSAPSCKGYSILTGTSNRLTGGETHEIQNITGHMDYLFYAIITLKDKIVFNKYQQKLNLPNHDYQVGQKVNLTGWEPKIPPRQLQKLELELLSMKECPPPVNGSSDWPIFRTEVCTNNTKESGMCIADGGSPLVSNGVLVGVTSWRSGHNCEGHSNTFANVYKVKDYINSVINASSNYQSLVFCE